MEKLRQLFYISRAAATLTDMDVKQILRVSQRNNHREGVTGCLLCSGKHFAQVLEGSPAAVEQLAARIAKDTRHHGFAVVLDREVGARRFPDWSMGILYKLDTVDRMEALLAGTMPAEELAFALLDEVIPDTVMGTL